MKRTSSERWRLTLFVAPCHYVGVDAEPIRAPSRRCGATALCLVACSGPSEEGTVADSNVVDGTDQAVRDAQDSEPVRWVLRTTDDGEDAANGEGGLDDAADDTSDGAAGGTPDDTVEKTTISPGFGIEGDGTRCSRPYASGTCYIPDHKVRYFYNTLGGSCLSIGGIDWRAIGESAIARLNADLVGTGASYLPGSSSSFNVKLRCSTPQDPSSGAETQAQHKSCDSNGVCKVSQNITSVNGTRLAVEMSAAGLTMAQKRQFVENIIKHELGHDMGLGHDPNPGLMNAHIRIDDVVPYFLEMHISSTEWTWIRDWVQ